MDKFKNKIIDRILKEEIEYKETNISEKDVNGDLVYSYGFAVEYTNNGEYVGGKYIESPLNSNELDIVKTYKLAHELGHHLLNKKLSPIVVQSYANGNRILTFFIEILAWNKAKKICKDEEIKITSLIFYKVMLRGLFSYLRVMVKVYSSALIDLIRNFAILFLFLSVVNLYSINQSSYNVFQLTYCLFTLYLILKVVIILLKKLMI